MDRKLLGPALRRLRMERDWSAKEVAAKVGRSAALIGQLERGDVNNAPTLQLLLDMYGVTQADLELLAQRSDNPQPRQLSPEGRRRSRHRRG